MGHVFPFRRVESCCYCEKTKNKKHLTVANLLLIVTVATSQEYLIKLPIGDRVFLLLLKLLCFVSNLSLNSLFCCTFTLVCNRRRVMRRVVLRCEK